MRGAEGAQRHRRTLTRAEAAEIFGITTRMLRRRSGRHDTEGIEGGGRGVQDRRIGQTAARAVPVDDTLRSGMPGGDPGIRAGPSSTSTNAGRPSPTGNHGRSPFHEADALRPAARSSIVDQYERPLLQKSLTFRS